MRAVAFLIALAFMAFEAQGAKHRTCRRYKHFDDYLSHCDFGSLDGREGGGQLTLSQQDDIEGSGSVSDLVIPVPPMRLPYRTGNTKSKKATCCMLGNVAGEKGYHCFAGFYLARIRMRNINRAHNKKIVFTGSEFARKSTKKLMKTFERCVSNGAEIFHKCCHFAAMTTPGYNRHHSRLRNNYRSRNDTKKKNYK